MAFLDKSKANYSFKSLLGKAHTSNSRELSNEAIASGIILSASRIFADKIHPTPNHASNTGIVSELITLTLEAVPGSDTQTLGTFQAYRTKLGGSVPTSLVGKINPLTNAVYTGTDYIGNIIPQSFGDDFRPILYSDAAATVEIPPSSSADWFIDCFAGIVVQEGYDDGSAFILGSNGRVKAYIYIGDFVADALGGSGQVNLFDGNGTTVELTNVGGTAGYAINLGGEITQSSTTFFKTNNTSYNHEITFPDATNALTVYAENTGFNNRNSYFEVKGNAFYANNINDDTNNTYELNLSTGSGAKLQGRNGFSDYAYIAADVDGSNNAFIEMFTNDNSTFSNNTFNLTYDGFLFNVQDATNANVANFVIGTAATTYTDGRTTTTGIEYAANYAAGYSNRSLVDKEFVVNQISYASTSSAVTASNGLTKIGNDIKLGGNLTQDVDIEGNFQFVMGANSDSLSFISLTAGDGTAFNSFSYMNLSQNFARLYNFSGGNFRGGVEVNSTGVALKGGFNSGNGDTFLKMGDNTANSTYFRDSRTGGNQSGLEYFADYSANFVDRSLVDKAYVDAVASGLDPKQSVRVATTSFITLSGLQTIDGVTLTVGDRVLVKDQGTAGVANGIYTASTAGWSRSSDFDGTPAAEVTAGAYTFVEEGTLNQDTGWVLSTNNPITVGTTSLTFVQFSAAGVINASNGLTKTGNNITLGGNLTQATTIDGSGNSLDIIDLNYFFVEDSTTQEYIYVSNNIVELFNSNPSGSIELKSYNTTYNNRLFVTASDTQMRTSNIINGKSSTFTLTEDSATLNLIGTYNTSLFVDSNTGAIEIDSSIITITNALLSSTSGYDIVVRNVTTGNLEKISGSVLTGSVPTLADKNLTPSAGTSGNGVPTSLTITYTPSADSYVDVKVNGISVYIGTSSANGDCYFAAPATSGVIGRAISDIQAGDEFFWNATIAGYYLDNLDRVSFDYVV